MERTGTLTLSALDGSSTVLTTNPSPVTTTLTQAAAARSIAFSSSSLSADTAAGTKDVTITSNSDWQVTTSDVLVTSLTFTPTTGNNTTATPSGGSITLDATGDGTLSVAYSANDTIVERTGTLTLSALDGSSNVLTTNPSPVTTTLTQAAAARSIAFSSNSLSADAAAGTKDVTITSNSDWQVTTSDVLVTSLTFTPTTGNNTTATPSGGNITLDATGDGTLAVAYSENGTPVERTGTLTLSALDGSSNVLTTNPSPVTTTLTQAAAARSIAFSSSSLSSDTAAGTKDVTITSNSDWRVTTSDVLVTSLTFTPTTGNNTTATPSGGSITLDATGDGTLAVAYSENGTPAERTGTLTLSARNGSTVLTTNPTPVTATLTQAAAARALAFSSSSLSSDTAAGTKDVTITSNSDWRVTTSDVLVTSLTFTPVSGSSVSATPSGGNITLDATGDGTLAVAYSANDTIAERTGTLTLSARNGSTVLTTNPTPVTTTLTQAAAARSIAFSSSSLSADAAAGTKDVTITSNSDWRVTTSDVLVTSLTFTPVSGSSVSATPSGGSITLDATGDGTLVVAYSANDTIAERTGTLTLSARNGSTVLTTNPSPVTTTLTQAAAARAIAFSSNSLSADEAAGTKDVTITSNSDWRVTTSDVLVTSLTFTPTTGNNTTATPSGGSITLDATGDGTLSVAYSANDTIAERTGTLTLSAKNGENVLTTNPSPVTTTLTQAAAVRAIAFSSSSLSADAAAGTKDVTITSNSDWRVTTSDVLVTSLTFTPTTGNNTTATPSGGSITLDATGDGTLAVAYSENGTPAERTGTLTLSSLDGSSNVLTTNPSPVTTTLTQAAAARAIAFSSSSLSADAAAGTKDVTITSNSDWRVTTSDVLVTSLTFTPTTGNNTTATPSGGSITLDATGDGTLSVAYSANDTIVERTGTLTLSALDGSSTVLTTNPSPVTTTLTQAAAARSIAFSSSSLSADAAAGTKDVTITSNSDWRVTTSDVLVTSLTFTPTTGNNTIAMPSGGSITLDATGDGTLVVAYSANGTIVERTGTLTLSARNGAAVLTTNPSPVTTTLTQAAAARSIAFSSSSLSADEAAGTKDVTITSNSDFRVTTSDTLVTLLTFTPVSGSSVSATPSGGSITLDATGDGTLSVAYSANATTAERIATLTLSARNGSTVLTTNPTPITITLTQEAAPVPTLTLTASGIVPPSGSEENYTYDTDAAQTTLNVVVAIENATGWRATATADTDNIVSLANDPLTGGNGETLAITIASNMTSSQRTATLTFTSTGGIGDASTRTLIITQLIATQTLPTLALAGTGVTAPSGEATNYTADATAAEETLNVEVSLADATGWSFSTTDAFVTSNPAMGGNDDDAELTITANPTVAERTATIIFTSTGGTGTATQTLIITQAAAARAIAFSSSSLSSDTAAGTKDVTITSNSDWRVTTSDVLVTSLTFTPTTGNNTTATPSGGSITLDATGDGTLVVAYSANDTIAERTGTLTLSAKNGENVLTTNPTPVTTTLTQAAAARSIAFSSSSLSADTAAGTKDVTITSNSDWRVTTSDVLVTSLTFTPTTGNNTTATPSGGSITLDATGDGTLAVAYSENGTPAERTGTLTLSSLDGSSNVLTTNPSPVTATLTQAAAARAIAFSSSSLSADAAAGTKGVTITSNSDWRVTTSDVLVTSLTFTPVSGSSVSATPSGGSITLDATGDGTLVVAYSANGTIVERTGTLTLSARNGSTVLTTNPSPVTTTLTQAAAARSIAFSSSSLSADVAAGTKDVTITSNSDWRVTTSDVLVTSLTFTPVSGSSVSATPSGGSITLDATGDGTLAVAYSANDTIVERTGTLTLSARNGSTVLTTSPTPVTTTLTQAAAARSIAFSSSSLSADAAAGTKGVTITSNSDWRVTTSDVLVTSLTFTPVSGSSVSATPSGGNITLDATGDGTLAVAYSANDTIAERTGTLTLSARNGSTVLTTNPTPVTTTLTQAAAARSIAFSSSSLSADAAAGTKDVTITSNSDWQVTTSDVLVISLTFTPVSGSPTSINSSGGSTTLDATGDGTLAVAYSENGTPAERTGTLTLSAKNGENVLTTNPSSVTTTLTQAAAARAIAFSSNSLSADVAAGTKDVTITSNSDWRVTTSDVLVTSLTFTPTTGNNTTATPSGGSITLDATGDGTLVVAYLENTTTAERTGTLTLSALDGSSNVLTTNPTPITITLTQEAAPVPTLTLTASGIVSPSGSEENYTYDTDAAQTTLNVVIAIENATGWSATETADTDNIVSLANDPATGGNGDALAVVISENTTLSQRTATLTFTSTGGIGDASTQTLVITQLIATQTLSTLALAGTGVTAPAGEATNYTADAPVEQSTLNVDVTLENATGWAVRTTADFVNLPNSAMGGNDDDAVLTITANPTVAERTATIIFTSTGGTGTATQTLIITQAAGPRTIAITGANSRMLMSAAGTEDIIITSNSDFRVTTSDVLVTSLTFTPTTGNNTIVMPINGNITLDATGDGTLSVAYSANATIVERTGTLTLSARNGSTVLLTPTPITITLTQEAAPAPTLTLAGTGITAPSGSEVNYTYDAVAAGLDLDVVVAIENATGWRATKTADTDNIVSLANDPSTGGNGETLTITIAANPTVAERTATIIFTSTGGTGTATQTLIITQAAGPRTIAFSTNNLSADVAAGTKDVTITSNSDWRVTTSDVLVTSLTFTPVSGFSVSATPSGGSTTLDATGDGTLSVAYLENTTTAERTATLTLSALDGSSNVLTTNPTPITITLTQEAAPVSTLTLTASGIVPPSGSEENYTYDTDAAQTTLNVVIAIENATGWSATETADTDNIVSLVNDPATGGNGETLTITIAANPTVAERTATIIFTSTGGTGTATQTLIITQAAGPRTIAFSTNNLSADVAAGTKDVTITSNSDWQVTTSDVLVTSLTFTSTTGNNTTATPSGGSITLDATGDGTLAVAYSENGTPAERTGTLTLSAKNGENVLTTNPTPVTATLTQAAAARTIAFSSSSLSADAAAGTKGVTITSNSDWRVITSDVLVTSLTFTPTTGSNTTATPSGGSITLDATGDGTLVVAYSANATIVERTGTLTLSALDGTSNVLTTNPSPVTTTLTQAAAARSIAFSSSSLSADAAAGTKGVTITSNSDWRVTTSDVLVTSLTFTPVSGSSVSATPSGGNITLDATGDGTLAVAYSENGTPAERTGTLTLSARNGSTVLTTNPSPVTTTLTQAAAARSIAFSSSSLSADVAAGTKDVTITSNSDWRVTTSDVLVTSLTFTPVSGSSVSATPSGGSITLDATGDGTLVVAYSANDTIVERTGTLTLSAKNGATVLTTNPSPVTTTLTQAAAARSIAFSSSSLSADAAAGTKDVTITSNSDWRVTTSDVLVTSLTFTPTTGNNTTATPSGGSITLDATGDGTLAVAYSENVTPAERTGILTLSARNGSNVLLTPTSITITLTQEAAPVPTLTLTATGIVPSSVSEGNYTYDTDASQTTLNVGFAIENATGWSFSTTDDFVTSNPSMGGNDDDAVLTITENTTPSQRTGTIVFTTTGNTGEAATQTLVITQLAATQTLPTLALAGTGVTAPSGEATNYTADAPSTSSTLNVVVSIENATGWRATEITDTDNIVSLTNDPVIGGNGETLVITIASNMTSSQRTGTLTFTSTGGDVDITQTLIITQAAAARALAFSSSSLSADAAAGTKDVTITSNSDWRVTTSDVLVTSLTFTPVSGSSVSATPSGGSTTLDATGDGTLVVAYSENGTPVERTGTLTLSVLDGSSNVLMTNPSPVTTTLTQAAAARAIAFSSSSLSADTAAGTKDVTITSNSDWQVTTSDVLVTSLTFTPTTGNNTTATPSGGSITLDATGDGTLVVAYSENGTPAERTGTLTLSSKNGENVLTTNPTPVTTTLTQAAAARAIAFSSSSLSADTAAGTKDVTITSNSDWRVTTSDVLVTSLTFTPTTGNNTTATPSGGSITLDATGDGTLVVAYSANGTIVERTGTLTLSALDGSSNVLTTNPSPVTTTLTQAAAARALAFSSSSLSADAAAGTKDVTITSNSDWRVTTSDVLVTSLTFTPTTGNNTIAMPINGNITLDATGDGTLVVAYSANATTAERRGTLALSARNGLNVLLTPTPVTTTLTQAAAGQTPSTLILTATGVTAPSGSEINYTHDAPSRRSTLNVVVAIENATGWRATATADTDNIVSLANDPSTGGNGEILAITIAVNTTSSQRTATLTFTSTGGDVDITQTLIITQAAAHTLGFSSSSLSVGAAAGSVDVDIVTNLDFEVRILANFVTELTFVPTSGSTVSVTPSSGIIALEGIGNGVLTIEYSENTSIAQRTTTLTLSELDGTGTVDGVPPIRATLTQAAAARAIAFSSNSLSADVAAGTKDVTITSNSDWRVTTSDVLVTSLTFTPTTGNNTIAMPINGNITLDGEGNGTLAVAYSANGTIVERTGTLTLSARNGATVLTTNPTPVTTTLTQAAAARSIAFSSSSLSADEAAGTKDVTITSNSDFRVTTSDTLVTSLTFTPVSGSSVSATPSGGSITLDATGDGTLSVAYSANATTAERIATLTLSARNGSTVLTTNPTPITITLTQEAAPVPTLTLTASGIVPPSGSEENYTYDTDAAQTTLNVVVAIENATGWRATATADTDNIVSLANDPLTGGNGETLAITIASNMTSSQRTATLTFTSTGGIGDASTRTLIITQLIATQTLPTLALAGTGVTAPSGEATNYTADATAAEETLNVEVSLADATGWSFSTTDAFVTSNPAMGGNDDDAELTITANPTVAERTATIIFTSTGGTGTATQTLIITQAAAARSIAFSSSSLSADEAAGTKDVTITSNSDWRVTTSDVLVTSLTFTPTTGNNTTATPSGGSITLDATGDGTLAVAYSENGTPVERTGTLTLSALDGSSNVLMTNPTPVTTTLTQAAAARAIAFSSSSLSSDTAAGTKDVTITSNSDWRVTTSDVLVTSLTFTPTTGNNTTATPSGGSITLDATGDGTLVVAYSANDTIAERTGTLTLSAKNGENVLTTNPTPVTTTLTQAAAARSIAFSSSSLSADTAAGTKDVTITSNSDWRVTTSDVLVTSLTFTPTTGNNTTATPSGGSITLDATGDGTLAVAYSENGTPAERTGTLTLSSLDGSSNVLTTNPSPVTATLTQAAAARAIAFSSSSLSADAAAGTKGVTITSNSDWRVTTSDVLVTSLTFTPVSGSSVSATPSGGSITLDATGDGTLVVAYSENVTPAERTGTLTLSARNGSTVLTTNPSPVTTTLTQAAAARSIAFSSSSLSADVAAGTKDVTITSNSDWRVTTSDVLVTSLTFTPVSGSSVSATPSGGSITLDATGDGTLVVAYSANDTIVERTGTLTLSAKNGATVLTTNPSPVTTTLTQAAAARSIAFSSSSLSADAAAGTKDVTITSNSDWRVTTSDVLVTSLTFTPTTGNNTTATPSGGSITLDATGDGTLAVAYSENVTPAERTGILTLSARNGSNVLLTPTSITITLTQEAAPVPTLTLTATGIVPSSVSEGNYTYDTDASQTTLNVGFAIENATGWSFSTTDDFVTSNPSMGGNDDDAVLTITENTTPSQRTGTIVFTTTGNTGEAATQTLVITQLAATQTLPTLALAGTGVTAPSGEATNYTADAPSTSSTLNVVVSIENATGWRATETTDTDNIVSLTNDPTIGGNGETLVITIASNMTSSQRTGTLTFTSTGGDVDITQTLIITQAAAARALAFSSSSLSADAAAGTKDVTITSNSDWRVTTSDVLVTSLTFTPVSGSSVSATPSGGSTTLDATGDGTLVVAYSENGTPVERTGTLTLSSKNGENVLTTNPTPVTTTLTQAAAARAIAFSSSSLSADTAAGTKDVTITSNSDWQVTTSDVLVTSLTFTPTTGNNTTATPSGGSITLDATGDGTLVVAYSENGTPAERTGTLTLSSKNGENVLTTNPTPVTTTLTQAAAARSIAFSSSSLSADTAAGTKDVTITSNSDWRVTTSDVLVTSLTFTPTTGNNTTATPSGGSITLDATGDGTLAVAYSENGTPAERTGTLTLSALDGSSNVLTTNPSPVTTTLTQAAAARALAFSSSSLSADAAAGTKDVTITSNSDWRVTTSDVLVTSLTFTPTTGNNTIAMPINGNITLDATGDGTLVVAYSANATTAERRGTLALSARNGLNVLLTPTPVTTTLTQAAAGQTPSTLILTATGVTAPSGSEINYTHDAPSRRSTLNVVVAIENATGWRATATADTDNIVSLANDPSTGGNGEILAITIAVNTTSSQRTATLTFTSTGGDVDITQTLIITQAAAHTLGFSSSSLSVGAAAGSVDVDIVTNLDFEVRILANFVTELTFVPTSGSTVSVTPSSGIIALEGIGNGVLTIEYSENTSIAQRTTTLTLSELDGTGTVDGVPPIRATLTQAAAARAIAFSSNSLSADVAAGTKDVTITSNSDWRVTTSDALVTSLTFTPTTGNNTIAMPSGGSITLDATGDGTLVVAYSANATTAERIGTLTLSVLDGSANVLTTPTPIDITLTQAFAAAQTSPTLTLSGIGITDPVSPAMNYTADVDAAETTLTVDVTLASGVTTWRATTTDTFVTFNSATGDNSMDALLTIAENILTATRTATITFAGTGGSVDITQTLIITQAAAVVLPTLTISVTGVTDLVSPATNYTADADAAGTTLTVDVTLTDATGWAASTTADFVTSNPAMGGNDDDAVLTIDENTTFAERMATITLITTGHEGTPDSVSLTITQGARADTTITLPPKDTTTTLYSYTRVNFSLYPNPTKGTLTIEGVMGHLQMYIHDLVGREVMTYSLTPSKKTIDVSNLPSGMYVVTLQGEDKTWTEVLIIDN